MADEINEVIVPQIGVNENFAILLEWYVSDESHVNKGDALCQLETTKAIFDVEAETSGYIKHLVKSGNEVKIGKPIALIGLSLDSIRDKIACYKSQTKTKNKNLSSTTKKVQATKKAKTRAQELKVDLTNISTNGIIQEKDVMEHYKKTQSFKPMAIKDLSWESTRKPVVIYGAGKGAVTLKECLDYQKLYQVVCFIDDNPSHPKKLLNLPVFHSTRLSELVKNKIYNMATEIANGKIRKRIYNECSSLGIDLINVIHPQAFISTSVKMGKGNYVKSGAIIETNTTIKNCCIIDNGVIIAHDNHIEDGCHLAPGVSMGSSVYIKEFAIIGVGSSIASGVKIGRASIISVGSAVTKDVPDYSVVEGIPGKVVGQRKGY